jgi:hypothetical protein
MVMVTNCPYCNLDTGGNHQTGCPNNPAKARMVDWFSHSDALVVGPDLEKKVQRIQEALRGVHDNRLSAESFVIVVDLILNPIPITDDDIKWATNVVDKTDPLWDELYK